MIDWKAQRDAAAEVYADSICMRSDDFRSDAKCDFEAGADWAREQAQAEVEEQCRLNVIGQERELILIAEITQLKNQLSMTNSNWPHEKKALDELSKAKAEIEQWRTERDIRIAAYEEIFADLTALRQAAEELARALDKVQAHGLHHYEDCSNAEYDDQNCNCGMEKAALTVLKAIENYRAKFGKGE